MTTYPDEAFMTDTLVLRTHCPSLCSLAVVLPIYNKNMKILMVEDILEDFALYVFETNKQKYC